MTPDEIKKLAGSFQQSRILLTAFELDIFTILDEHLLTSAQVAEKINADERGTDRLMNALSTFDFLHKTKNKFFNSEHSSRYLVKGKPGYMGGLMHTNHLWNTWSTLTDAVKKGSTVIEKDINKRGDEWLEAFIAAMHNRGTVQAKIISMMLDLTNVKQVLDVGGGSGAFSMTMVKSNEIMRGIIFDLPNVIPIAKKYVEEEKLLDRFDFIAGNYLTDNFEMGNDLILLSAIIHINSFEENKELIAKCAESLNPGGQVVIYDQIMDEDRITPPNGAVFALNMLVGTEKGDTYTQSEIKSWFESAGLTDVEFKNTSFGSSLMIARKK